MSMTDARSHRWKSGLTAGATAALVLATGVGTSFADSGVP